MSTICLLAVLVLHIVSNKLALLVIYAVSGIFDVLQMSAGHFVSAVSGILGAFVLYLGAVLQIRWKPTKYC